LTQETFIQELTELFSPYFIAQGLELVDLVYRHEGQRLIITVLADKPQGYGLASNSQSHKPQGGITLQECALACRQLKDILEEKNIINCDYFLEVSSPGLDRPLKSKNDFLRCLNQEAVFFLNDLVKGKCQWQGLIHQAGDAAVVVCVAGEFLEIPLIKINKAQLVI